MHIDPRYCGSEAGAITKKQTSLPASNPSQPPDDATSTLSSLIISSGDAEAANPQSSRTGHRPI